MQGTTTDHSAVRQAVDATNRRFMERFNSGDIATAAEGVYTKGARVLPPGAELVRGRENIVGFWQGAAAALGLTHVELTTLELEVHSGGAHEIGRAELTLEGDQHATGKYVVVWKEEEGAWRWDVDIWNMDG